MEEIISEETLILSGAIQGSVIGPVLFLIFVKDMTKKIKSNTKLFVDDAKLKNSISKEDDVEAVQEDLDELYHWQKDNNMKFNGAKFQLLRYGPHEDIKENTIYFTEDMEDVILQWSSLRDLGVIMSDNGRFDDHIDKVTKTVRQKIGWIMRSFHTRRLDILKQI